MRSFRPAKFGLRAPSEKTASIYLSAPTGHPPTVVSYLSEDLKRRWSERVGATSSVFYLQILLFSDIQTELSANECDNITKECIPEHTLQQSYEPFHLNIYKSTNNSPTTCSLHGTFSGPVWPEGGIAPGSVLCTCEPSPGCVTAVYT